jgi:hypothetical protein
MYCEKKKPIGGLPKSAVVESCHAATEYATPFVTATTAQFFCFVVSSSFDRLDLASFPVEDQRKS